MQLRDVVKRLSTIAPTGLTRAFSRERRGDLIDVQVAFNCFEQFSAFHHERPELFTDETENRIIRHCLRHGVKTKFQGHIPAKHVALRGPESRESLVGRGFKARHRAVLDAALQSLSERGIPEKQAKIYGHEAITRFALLLRGRFPKFIGTEYARDDQERAALFPIPHGDICASDYPDNVFDLILSGDVMEHIPDIDLALQESARILVPGGLFIGTFPFLFHRRDSDRRARIVHGDLVHYEEPIYHGNPMDPEGGSLVFEHPAWDILERARNAGFAKAEMILICNQLKGIVGSSLGFPFRPRGVFLAHFEK